MLSIHLAMGRPTITASLCASTSDMPHCTCQEEFDIDHNVLLFVG